MDLSKKILKHIAKILNVETTKLDLGTGVGDIQEWDSLAHSSWCIN